MNLVLVPIILVVLLSPLYYEYPSETSAGSTVVTFEGNKVVSHPKGLFIWEWSSNFANLSTSWQSFNGGVSVVTENPKVRRINYELFSRIKSPEDFYSKEYRRSFSHENQASYELYKLVEYHIYNFNNEHSKELAGFWNPLDDKQNEELKKLLEGYFNEHLAADGVEVAFQKFSIE